MSDHSQRAHSRYAASAASRWFACPGSVRLCDGVPETTSAYALEGTRAHELLELLLVRADADGSSVWFEASKDMQDAVLVAFNYVADLLDNNPGAELLTEHRFTIPSDVAPGEVFGTNDVCVYLPSTKTLYVIDYKHGSGVAVEVKGNKQLRFYGVGALFDRRLAWSVSEVVLVIIQPRAFHHDGPIREERLSAVDLIDFSADIDEHIAAAQKLNAPLVPGDEQCRWCAAASFCPAREKQALAALGDTFADVRQVTLETLPEPGTLPLDKIGHILGAKKLIIDWLESVEAKGVELALAGSQVPGRKLVRPIGRRQWEGDPVAIANTLAEITGVGAKEWFEMSLFGITDAEKRVKEALKPQGKEAVKFALDKFAFLTTKKSSDKLTLVSEDDSRPAVNPAVSAFEGVAVLPHITTGA